MELCKHYYRDFSPSCFWQSVANQHPLDLKGWIQNAANPLIGLKIALAGSCFAQHQNCPANFYIEQIANKLLS